MRFDWVPVVIRSHNIPHSTFPISRCHRMTATVVEQPQQQQEFQTGLLLLVFQLSDKRIKPKHNHWVLIGILITLGCPSTESAVGSISSIRGIIPGSWTCVRRTPSERTNKPYYYIIIVNKSYTFCVYPDNRECWDPRSPVSVFVACTLITWKESRSRLDSIKPSLQYPLVLQRR